MRIIYLLFIFIHPLRAVDVSKMKTIQAKVQKTIQKSSTRETNLKIAQDTNPKSFSTSNPNNEREKYSSDLIVEYFVRKKDTGLWIFYDYQDVPDTFVREYDQRYYYLLHFIRHSLYNTTCTVGRQRTWV